MRDMNKAINAARTVEEIGELLDELARGIKGMIEKGRVSAGRVPEMAALATELRVLLADLAAGDLQARGMSRELTERYLEIEGKLKEIRNDLDRGRTSDRGHDPAH